LFLYAAATVIRRMTLWNALESIGRIMEGMLIANSLHRTLHYQSLHTKCRYFNAS